MALRFPYRLAAAACLGLSSFAGAADAPRLLPSAAVAGQADQQLADAVASKLAQAGSLSGYQVEVTCVAGTVELTGSVSDPNQKAEVSKLVAGVKGVRKIENKLEVRGEVQAAQAVEQIPGPGPGGPPTMMPGPSHGMLPGGPPMMQGGMPQGGMMGGGYGNGMDPTPLYMPPTGGLYDSTPPKMPPYAWPTYAPYNNYSRVGYPTEYPANAFPFIGPFYPFPKVPLGFRAIKLEWEDGHWYYGRTATNRDYWKVRYW